MKQKIYVVGIGPGAPELMTSQAKKAIEESSVIAGYPVYLQLLGDAISKKRTIATPMTKEEERCRLCFEEAKKGNIASIVCSGDAGVYGMASLMYELLPEYPDCELEIVPGITAAISGAAILGAPLGHDFCVISLSDRLTPWSVIEKRLLAAADGDFCIAIYNPSSKGRPDYLKRACEILLKKVEPDRKCGYVRNIAREGTATKLCTLEQLKDEQVDMFTTVFIGNSQSRVIKGKLVTSRGYHLDQETKNSFGSENSFGVENRRMQ